MRKIKFRCWFDGKMHRVVDVRVNDKGFINLYAADIIRFDEGILMQYIRG